MADTGPQTQELASELSKLLSHATSAPAASAGSPEALFFGMTLAGLLLATFFSLLGLAYLTYARKQSRLIIGLCGVGLLIFPFFVTRTLGIALVGTLLALLPTILKRAGVDL